MSADGLDNICVEFLMADLELFLRSYCYFSGEIFS